MAKDKLIEIADRLATASTGPWIVETGPWSGDNWLVGSVHCGTSAEDGKDYCCYLTTDHVHASEVEGDAKTDAEWIAAARSDMRWLIAEVKRLRLALAQLQPA